MSKKIEIINLLKKADNDFIAQNTTNIYKLAATIKNIEDRVYKKVS